MSLNLISGICLEYTHLVHTYLPIYPSHVNDNTSDLEYLVLAPPTDVLQIVTAEQFLNAMIVIHARHLMYYQGICRLRWYPNGMLIGMYVRVIWPSSHEVLVWPIEQL